MLTDAPASAPVAGAPVGKGIEVRAQHAAVYSGACCVLLHASAVSAGARVPRGQKAGYIWRGLAAREGALQVCIYSYIIHIYIVYVYICMCVCVCVCVCVYK